MSLIALATFACGSPDDGETLLSGDAGFVLPDASESDAGEIPDSGVDAGTIVDAGTPDSGDVLDLRDRLLSIEGLDVEELFAPIEGTRAFALELRQPEDHRNPNGVWFKQRLVLIHKDERAPMVLHTTGYGLFGDPQVWASYELEPTIALGANQLTVEHRFFGESIAREPTWSRLTIEQSASDSHRIVELLSSIYGGAWVGTGVSKGGMTAIFHHRYFPEDLDAIVPYVAPISFGVSDPRYIPWVAQIGPPDGICRERVKDMAVELIERRAEIAQYYIATDPAAVAFRPEVVEALATFPAYSWHWGFWQALGSPDYCAALPPRNASIDWLAAWFPFQAEYAFGFGFDPEVSPYEYQVQNELGSQAIDTSHIAAAIAEVDYGVLPQIPPMPPPWGNAPLFNPLPIQQVDAFLRNEARHVLGVYGAWDPWSGGIITVNEANDSMVIVVPQIGHAAQLSLLPPQQQDQALDRLSEWIGRSSLVPRDWTRTRERMQEHRAQHEWLVKKTLELDRRMMRSLLSR